jgi:Cu2+-exporting ATPase
MHSPSPEHAAHEHDDAMPHAPEGSGHAHSAHDRHEGHSVAMFRDRFWITLLLSMCLANAPVLVVPPQTVTESPHT